MSGANLEFSPRVASVLRKGGWSPERQVEIGWLREQIEHYGFVVHPEAERVLVAFEGLILWDVLGSPMRMDGAYAAGYFESEDHPYLAALFPVPLCPVGELSGMIYLVAEDGRWVVLHEGWTVMYVLLNANDAFQFALLRD